MNLIDVWKRALNRRRDNGALLLKLDKERKAIAKEQVGRLLELQLIKPEEPGIYSSRTGDINPALRIGAALRLAKKYGIEIQGGICFATVRAVLPEEKWRNIADWEHCPDVNKGHWGWCERLTLPEAVCCCLINCREQGIL